MVRALTLAALSFALLAAAHGRVGNAAQHPARQEAKAGQPVQAPSQNTASPVEGQPAAQPYNPPCERGDDNRRSDLCAQWKAANAASESAQWTQSTFWAAAVGVAVAILTLFAAVAAALFARAAAREARRGATAAADQVDISRDTASKELRAYIGVLGAKAFYIGSALPRVVIEIKNYGKTPAFYVTGYTRLYIDTHQTGFPGKTERGGTVTFSTEFGIVEPGQERVIWVNLPEDWLAENIEGLKSGEARLFSETKIDYSDVGGVSRHRGFNCALPRIRNPDGADPGVRMTITAGGNVDSWIGEWAKRDHGRPPQEGETAD